MKQGMQLRQLACATFPAYSRSILTIILHVWLVICMQMLCVHCKKRGVTEHPRGAIFYCFCGNSMGYHGNSKILLPWGVPIHRVFYSVYVLC